MHSARVFNHQFRDLRQQNNIFLQKMQLQTQLKKGTESCESIREKY